MHSAGDLYICLFLCVLDLNATSSRGQLQEPRPNYLVSFVNRRRKKSFQYVKEKVTLSYFLEAAELPF